MLRKLLRKWFKFKYRKENEDICCCGENMNNMYPGLSCPGYCFSMKHHVIDQEIERAIKYVKRFKILRRFCR
jgi:hypothetical protein